MTMNRNLTNRTLLALLVPLAVLAMLLPGVVRAQEPEVEGRVRVASLVYGGGKTGICFASGFLDNVARETGINVQRSFDTVDLASDEVFNYPFLVMTGEGAFTLPDDEKSRLREYIQRGGFLLASAGCSNAAWIGSFQDTIAEVFGEDQLQPLDLEHPLFQTLYEIDAVQMKKQTSIPAIHGLSHQGRLRIVFSPMGLNDTGQAEEGCCCCGGNEVRNARFINANILLYALTH